MTALAASAAASAILAYILRRTAKPADTLRATIANALSLLSVALVGIYFYLRFTS